MIRLFAIFPLVFSALAAANLDDLTWTIDNGEVTIVSCQRNASGVLDIPDMIEGFPVTAIGDLAFSWCEDLTAISVPDGATSIGKSAFSLCFGLKEFTLPSGLIEIEKNLFSDCIQLRKVVIPEGVLAIRSGAFLNCSDLLEVRLPESLTFIGSSAFDYCFSLKEISIPDRVTLIGAYAFAADYWDWASLPPTTQYSVDVSIGKGVEHIGSYAFGYRYPRVLTVPASTTSMDIDATNAGTVFFEGAAPELPFVSEQWEDVLEPAATTIYVWPQHFESFDKGHPLWDLSRIIVRDTSPKISSLFLESKFVTISITGAPNTTYLCKTSDDLSEFRVIETNPETLMLDSTGKMDFSVQTDLAGQFFVIEKSP